MCLIALRHHTHPRYPLVLLANRDEFYARETAPAAPWEDAPDVLGGRDLLAAGTWLCISRKGRWAAVTNVRAPSRARGRSLSRGALTAEFVRGDVPIERYAQDVRARADDYERFNLLLGDLHTLVDVSSERPEVERFGPGDYVLSNASLDTLWPKARALRERILDDALADDEEAMLAALGDRRVAPDAQLPDTGVGIELERLLSPVFVTSPSYGTRASTILRVDAQAALTFVERSFGEQGRFLFERRHALHLEP